MEKTTIEIDFKNLKTSKVAKDLDSIIAVYSILNLKTRKFYIGSTQELGRRVRKHLFELRSNKHHCSHLQRAWSKYGEDNFKIVTEWIVEDISEARYLEQRFLDDLSLRKMLYNISFSASGGDLLSNHPRKKEIIAKRVATVKEKELALSDEERKIRKKKLSDRVSGDKNPMYKHVYSEETLDKLSKPRPNLSKALKGRVFSIEHKKKLSENARKRVGEKNPFYGRKHSEEYCRKASERAKEQRKSNPNGDKVVINGIQYVSKSEAARCLGVSVSTILFRLKSDSEKFKDYKILENE